MEGIGIDAKTGKKVRFDSALPEATFVFRVGEEIVIPRDTIRGVAQELGGSVDVLNSTLFAVAVVDELKTVAEKLYRFQETLGNIFTGMCVGDTDVFCLGPGSEKGEVVYNYFKKKEAITYTYDPETQDLKEFYLGIAEKKEREQDKICLEFFKGKLNEPEISEAMTALRNTRRLATEAYKGSDVLLLCNYIAESFGEPGAMPANERMEYALAAEFADGQCVRGNFDAKDIFKKYQENINVMALINDVKLNKTAPQVLTAIGTRVEKQKAYVKSVQEKKK